MNDRQFNGKVALVTGGASGIGEACVLAFAGGGAKVVIVDRDRQRGEKAAAAVERAGSEALVLAADVADPDAAREMVADAVAAFGRLDIAVNNAGVSGEFNPTGEYSVEGWRKVIDINLNAVFYGMRHEIPAMLKNGSGAIVNMSSILGSVGFAHSPAYVAAKHGVVGLTRTAALEYATRGIRINAVGPAFIRTPLLDALDAETLTRVRALHAFGRLGEPPEVAALVTFLASDEASFMTGGYYLVDGGYTAQ